MDDGIGVTPEGAGEETPEAASQAVEQTGGDQPEASEKTEITQDEISAIEDGGEAESRAVPYERFKEVNDQYRAIREEMAALREKAKIADQLTEAFKPKEVDNMPPQVRAALDTLKQYGIRSEDEILAKVEEKLESKLSEREFAQKLLTEAETLEKKYDGSNGLPRFDRAEVAKWLDAKGFTQEQLRSGGMTLEGAYRAIHGAILEDARVKEKRSTAYSEKPGQPMASNQDTRNADLEEAKKSGDWTKYIMKRGLTPFNK